MSNYYDFPVPSSSSSHQHQHTHTPPNPKSSSTTRARDISRLLDPLYAPSSSSYSARIPSCAPTAVYVDHYGNVHDPDYRPFPPPPLSHSHSHSRAPALTRAASGFVRPRWETGFEDSPIDGEEYGDDDDDDELEGSEYGTDAYTPIPIPRRASTPPSQFQTQTQQAQYVPPHRSSSLSRSIANAKNRHRLTHRDGDSRLNHRDCDSRLNHRDCESRLNHRDSISTYRSSTPYTTTTTFADSSPPTSYESEQTYLTHPDPDDGEADDTPFVGGCGDDPFVRVRADDDLRNHRGGKDETQTITTTKCVVHKTKKRHTHTTRAHTQKDERKSRLRGLPKEKAQDFLNEKSPSSPYPSPYSPSSYYDDSDPMRTSPYVPTHHQSDSTSEIWTPTCGQALKREWQAISLRLRFGVFRAQRKVRRRMGGT